MNFMNNFLGLREMTEEDHLEMALSKLGRIVLKGVGRKNGYIFYSHEAREVLKDFMREIKSVNDTREIKKFRA